MMAVQNRMFRQQNAATITGKMFHSKYPYEILQFVLKESILDTAPTSVKFLSFTIQLCLTYPFNKMHFKLMASLELGSTG